MKRATAINHLVEMAEVATEQLRLRSTELGWPLEEMWVTGTLLEPVRDLEHGAVVLMLDLPPEELPWLAVHPTAEWVGSMLRLGKRPLGWSYRPIAWSSWTYSALRVARFWSATDGLDRQVIGALRSMEAVPVVEPESNELRNQLQIEFAASKAHLRSIIDTYWDRDWRRTHRHATTPEDQLWRAATAVTEIEAAIAEHGP